MTLGPFVRSCNQRLTVRGRISTLSWSRFIPGMITDIFRGPLNPSTLVSWNTTGKSRYRHRESNTELIIPSYKTSLQNLSMRHGYYVYYWCVYTCSLKYAQTLSPAHQLRYTSVALHVLDYCAIDILLIVQKFNLTMPHVKKITSSWCLTLIQGGRTNTSSGQRPNTQHNRIFQSDITVIVLLKQSSICAYK